MASGFQKGEAEAALRRSEFGSFRVSLSQCSTVKAGHKASPNQTELLLEGRACTEEVPMVTIVEDGLLHLLIATGLCMQVAGGFKTTVANRPQHRR